MASWKTSEPSEYTNHPVIHETDRHLTILTPLGEITVSQIYNAVGDRPRCASVYGRYWTEHDQDLGDCVVIQVWHVKYTDGSSSSYSGSIVSGSLTP
jgi:hypothetical protein